VTGAGDVDETVTVDDLRRDELDLIGWSGSASHIKNVAGQLDRRDAGVLEYLVLRDASGAPIAKAAIDYEEFPGAGSVMQVATRSDLEGRGYARRLLEEAEMRIRARGLRSVRLSVEPENTRAVRLYQFVGFTAVGEREIGWEYEDDDGATKWHTAHVIDMEKAL